VTFKHKLLWMVVGGVLVLVLVCASCAPLFLLASAMAGTEVSSSVGVGPAVAVVRVEGVILSGDAPSSPFGDTTGAAYSGVVIGHLKQAEEDADVKAVVLRVNSPGGSVVGSSEIHEQMLAMTKPLVVSMGEMAASGGYYVSAPADEIFANSATLTGSIGVISQFLDLSGLFEEYGVAATIIKSGTYKDTGSMFREMTEPEKEIWQSIIDQTYEEFVRIVAEGRDLPVEEVTSLADGRVYTGQQAMDLGLVDTMGDLPDAIDRAAELGDISGEPRIQEYMEPLNFLETMFSLTPAEDPMSRMLSLLTGSSGPTLQYLYVAP
jgi:protease IV